jgi:L-fuconolactonase
VTYDNRLNHVVEKALEPCLPICDAHIHIKNLERRRYLAADFVKDAGSGHNIVQSVVLQHRVNYEDGLGGGMSPVDETAFVMNQIAGLKSNIDVAAGFVCYADLAAGKAVQEILEKHLKVGKNRFKGIRYPQPPAPVSTGPSILSDPRFREGFNFLSKFNLTWELSLGMSQFKELADIAAKYPDTHIIIDHLGWPADQAETLNEKDELIAGWRRNIQLVASFDNIFMKLGGSTMPRYGFAYASKDRQPTSDEIVQAVSSYYIFLIEQFGPERCMFESNFPKEKKTVTYNAIWNAFKLITGSFTKTERSYLFHHTANNVYNL